MCRNFGLWCGEYKCWLRFLCLHFSSITFRSLRSLFQRNVRAHPSPGPQDYLWRAVTNRECLALDPPCSSRLLCVSVHSFPKLACQDLSASVCRTHACHFESSLDLLMLRFHQKFLTDPFGLDVEAELLLEDDDHPGTTRETQFSIVQVKCLPIWGQSSSFTVFPLIWTSSFWAKLTKR